MKKVTWVIGVVVGLLVIGLGMRALLQPWYSTWGATQDEISMALPGDELVINASTQTTKAISIDATPEEIFPWLVQMGADKGGLYSYEWIEALINCPNTNANAINPDWQSLQIGDPVRMCPGEFGPPPFSVAQIQQGRSLVWGHPDPDGTGWQDSYQFVLLPTSEGSTRLVLRSRGQSMGPVFDSLDILYFLMEREMLMGIQARAEGRISASN